MCIYIYIWTLTCYIYIYIYRYTHNVYICIHIYKHIYIYIYIHTHTHTLYTFICLISLYHIISSTLIRLHHLFDHADDAREEDALHHGLA